MTPNPWSVTAAALVVMIAGCASYGGAGGTASSPTVTPAPLATDQPTTSPAVDNRTGINDGEVTNASRVASRHVAALAGKAFRRRTTLRITDPSGRLQAGFSRTLVMGPSGDRFHYQETRVGDWADEANEAVSTVLWSGDRGIQRAVRFRNGTTVRTAGGRTEHPVTATFRRPTGDRIEAFLSAVDADVVNRASGRDGRAVDILALDISPTVLPLFLNPHGNARLRAGIADSGLVTSLRVSYDVHRGGQTLLYRWEMRYEIIDDVAVEAAIANATAPGSEPIRDTGPGPSG